MRSSFYYKGHYRKVASGIKDLINSSPDFLSSQTAGSPRAVGDAIESLISEKFDTFLGPWCDEYSNDFARRAMADLAFTDTEGVYSVVDVKTHREDTRFNMPNLTSVERLSRFYESDMNVFSVIIVRYSIEGTRVTASEALFSPIEFLDWDCLTIGALGWGADPDLEFQRHSGERRILQEAVDVAAMSDGARILPTRNPQNQRQDGSIRHDTGVLGVERRRLGLKGRADMDMSGACRDNLFARASRAGEGAAARGVTPSESRTWHGDREGSDRTAPPTAGPATA